MKQEQDTILTLARRELFTLIIMAFIGVLFVPIAIYMVGSEIFGDYAGAGFGEFFRDIHSQLRDGQLVVVFLLLSPYVVWQMLRLTVLLFRHLAPNR